MRTCQSALLSVVIVVVLTGAFSTIARAQTAEGSTEWPYWRVRGADPEIRHLLQAAALRSTTFVDLVEELQSSNAIVLVAYGQCAKGQIRSCVTGVEGDRQQRAIHIVVDTRTTELRLMATIAHELQHAVEIIREPSAVDRATTMALYRRIAKGKCKDGLSERCETELALATERRVLDELYR